jgi:hypothetical protein
VAWNEKPHFVMRDVNVDDVIANAQPEDVDVFGRMVLVGRMGIDEVKGWFYDRRGTF